MIEFAKSTKPPEAEQQFRVIGYGLGLIATGMAVAQMVSFEEFVAALRDYALTGERGAVALAIALISLEVFSVPFLFRLSLSPLARLLSALFVVIAPCVWAVLVFAALMGDVQVPNAGLFGGFLSSLPFDLAVAFVAAWAATVGFVFSRLGGYKALKPKKF
ncbi:MAG TPA: hypothetical protein VJM46_04390 [Candidatus Saccharimonadales bacterium]|nr:hypothetical protein [Candidatus Saccharimonadales bacterium]